MTEKQLEDLDGIEGRNPNGRVVSITTNLPFNMNGDPAEDFKKASEIDLFQNEENCFSC